ncbi:hypothetical protein NPIL_547021 [Nephila pilipes]|uniref:Uncharacterized protein n=1 Tax=Nephila pilipes TaxID=299642 RepID=A0A8X6MHS9_NEPPI|nr:hypothetical protein NPIL_547021 [Nephila pilipes]
MSSRKGFTHRRASIHRLRRSGEYDGKLVRQERSLSWHLGPVHLNHRGRSGLLSPRYVPTKAPNRHAQYLPHSYVVTHQLTANTNTEIELTAYSL